MCSLTQIFAVPTLHPPFPSHMKFLGLSDDESKQKETSYNDKKTKVAKQKVAKVEFSLGPGQGTLTLIGSAEDFQRMEKIDPSKPSPKNLDKEVTS